MLSQTHVHMYTYESNMEGEVLEKQDYHTNRNVLDDLMDIRSYEFHGAK